MLKIINGDITNCKTDAIVNAANNYLKEGSGVCGAIFKKAGSEKLQKECDEIGYCNTGESVITKGYNLDSKFIIHTVGPIWYGGNKNEEEYLRASYRNSLILAKKHNLNSIAFPLISAGIYGYPYEDALKIAKDEINKFLENNEIDVYLVLFN
ncbi:macro domain-containing protein [Peptoniphilus stercorisuis]|uniref:O-acetyl-ADP-ribose deacetylase (Regulator of RNase III) n=1 Tax=Peptoniphilus stercorisuis TaxID=1436965 RepID=A0ABS4KEL5_9FIRM|nr:O-acetyl-ADP-ribose deacetylase (regulator of RNase III) [Peptoniphilus stercorisuis]